MNLQQLSYDPLILTSYFVNLKNNQRIIKLETSKCTFSLFRTLLIKGHSRRSYNTVKIYSQANDRFGIKLMQNSTYSILFTILYY